MRRQCSSRPLESRPQARSALPHPPEQWLPGRTPRRRHRRRPRRAGRRRPYPRSAAPGSERGRPQHLRHHLPRRRRPSARDVLRWVAEVQTPELVRLFTSLSRWPDEIVAYYHTSGVSSAPVKAVNHDARHQTRCPCPGSSPTTAPGVTVRALPGEVTRTARSWPAGRPVHRSGASPVCRA